jgi:hypothetical protein
MICLRLSYDPARRQDGELLSGLLDPNGDVGPAGSAFRSVAAAARDAAWRGVSGGGISGIAFERDGATTLVLWSDTGATLPQPVLLTMPVGLAEAVRIVP